MNYSVRGVGKLCCNALRTLIKKGNSLPEQNEASATTKDSKVFWLDSCRARTEGFENKKKKKKKKTRATLEGVFRREEVRGKGQPLPGAGRAGAACFMQT